MSINWKIPPKSTFISTSNIFDAPFGTITPGVYDWTNDPTHRNNTVINIENGVLYLIERISVGGNIAEENYLGAINEFPRMILTYQRGGGALYPAPIPIVNYFDGKENVAWAYTEKSPNELQMSFYGILNQTAPLVGVDPVRIHIGLSIYSIRSPQYISAYNDYLTNKFGQGLRN